jgi:hypothetical protein
MKKFTLLFFISMLGFGVIFNAGFLKIQAEQSRSVHINEFLPDATGSDSGKEWVELYNDESNQVNLNNWVISTQTSSGSTRNLILPDLVIEPNAYFIIAEDQVQYSGSNIKFFAAGKLNMFNSSAKITLKDSLGNTISSLDYMTSQEGRSWESRGVLCGDLKMHPEANTIGLINLSYDPGCSSLTTDPPDNETPVSMPQSPPLYKTLLISEIYPYPETEKEETEWLEIFNYGNTEVNLKNYSLKEKLTGFDEFSTKILNLPDYRIKPGEYYVITEPDLTLSLNNSGDKIGLFLETELIDEVIYPSTDKGLSVARVFTDSSYQKNYSNIYPPFSTSPTKGSQNIHPELSQLNSENIIEIKKLYELPLGSVAKISGVASVDSGIFGERIIYIQDLTGGIRVQFGSSIELDTQEGQKMFIKGELRESSNERKFFVEKSSEIIIVPGNFKSELKPVKSPLDLSEFSGVLVSFSGILTTSYATSFDISYKGLPVRVSILQSTEIELPSKKKGDTVSVVGLFVKYTNNIFKIFPRSQKDLLISTTSVITELKDDTDSEIGLRDLEERVLGTQHPVSFPSSKITYLPDFPAQMGQIRVYVWPLFVLATLIYIHFTFRAIFQPGVLILKVKKYISDSSSPYLVKFAVKSYN